LAQHWGPYRRPASRFCLWFWQNHCNAVAMFLAGVLMRDIHPPVNIQNGGCSGGGWMPFISALARTNHGCLRFLGTNSWLWILIFVYICNNLKNFCVIHRIPK
jgi:hypothetical protein